jgi:hypothetical protein
MNCFGFRTLKTTPDYLEIMRFEELESGAG